MRKNIFTLLIACLLLLSFQGCYQSNAKLDSNNPASASSTQFDSMASDTQSGSVEITASIPEIKFNTAASNSAIYKNNEYLANMCFFDYYDFKIMKSFVEGTISNSDLQKLKQDEQASETLSDAFGIGNYKPSFDDNTPGVIGQTAAAQKVKEYIKKIYSYEIPMYISPVLVSRSSPEDENRKQTGPFYTVQYYIPNQNSKADEYHNISADIDAKSGRCLSASFSNTAVKPIYKPTDQEITNMQQRVLEFVTGKIEPDARCVYIFTDLLMLQDPDFAGFLFTNVYLDNGNIINVGSSVAEGGEMDFSIYKSHGFVCTER